DVRYSPFPRAMSCSRFSYAIAVNSRAFWLSVMTPSASIHSPGLVLDVNFANVSTVAFVVLQAETTSTVLARTTTLTSPFNVIVRMRLLPQFECHVAIHRSFPDISFFTHTPC